MLAVVVAYELVRRYRINDELQRVGRALAAQGTGSENAKAGV